MHRMPRCTTICAAIPGCSRSSPTASAISSAERDRQGKRFPINIKPTVNSKNFRLMPELVNWAMAKGVSCVQLQPMDRWTPETYDELWIEDAELK